MQIFYLKTSELLKKFPLSELEKYSDGRIYKNEKKYIQHLCGLYLIKYIAEKHYFIKDTSITSENDKPKFLNSNLKFSVSHSEDIVLAAFDYNNLGVDIEKMKDRDYSAILNYYKTNTKDITKKKFYKFWTNYEAEIKLGTKALSKFNTILENDYMLTCVSDEIMTGKFDITKL